MILHIRHDIPYKVITVDAGAIEATVKPNSRVEIRTHAAACLTVDDWLTFTEQVNRAVKTVEYHNGKTQLWQ